MKVILIILSVIQIYAQDYSELQLRKEANRAQSKASTQSESSIKTEQSNIISIHLKDTKQFDFANFEQMYDVKFLFCIAHSICTFENKSSTDIKILIEKIKRENNNIRDVRVYKKYKMKPY